MISRVDILNISDTSKYEEFRIKLLQLENLVKCLDANGEEAKKLFVIAQKVKDENIGNTVHLRGLIELSNFCRKNCYYCGIRRDNKAIRRYRLTEEEIINSARYAYENGMGSIVLQAGENTSNEFIEFIEKIIKKIKKDTRGNLGITLSLGEQNEETYIRWREAGAHRYLLRIETSDPILYKQLHPTDSCHDYEERLTCLHILKKIDYQVGTGVMIGLPFQTMEHLAKDLLFMHQLDIDMCGMGPYIEHAQTPLYELKNQLIPIQERFLLSLKMIALLRILMPNINIAATTALQAIDPMGREKAIRIGANIIMPNITPASYRANYLLYENKPCIDENAEDCLECIEARLSMINHKVGRYEWGDSRYYILRKEKSKKSLNMVI